MTDGLFNKLNIFGVLLKLSNIANSKAMAVTIWLSRKERKNYHFNFNWITLFSKYQWGWVAYYNKSSGPKFTEEQIRIADAAAGVLDYCHPITDFVGSENYLEIFQCLNQEQFVKASMYLENELPPLTKANCFEALKMGVWLLGCTEHTIQLR